MTSLSPLGTDADFALELVSQVVDYALIGLDVDGVIRSWNPGAERVKGYCAAEAIGRHFSVFYLPEDRHAGLPDHLLRAARREGRVASSGWRVRKDGSRFWGDVVITALRDRTGTLTGYAKVTRDRTEDHALQRSLRASEARQRLIMSHIVDYAIIALDLDGVIRTWNVGAERVKGYTADEAVGRHFSIFYTAADREDGLADQLLAVARDQGRADHAGWRVRKDGSRFWAEVVITALRDEDDRLTGYVKMTRDRTDQHRAEELQASLFAMMSHDIRQPLTAIGIHASLIADLEQDVRAEYAERILTAAEQLESMISTLLDHARLRAGVVSVHLEDVPLGPALREAVAAYDHLLAGREVVVTEDGVVATADPIALRRVLANLITNAAKYSPAGTPIAVTAAGAGQRAVVRVVDHGRGVAPEDLPVIFTEFVRGQLATDDGGTGLGLASVKHLVEQQGGTVRMDSTVGVGTTVTVELPRAEL